MALQFPAAKLLPFSEICKIWAIYYKKSVSPMPKTKLSEDIFSLKVYHRAEISHSKCKDSSPVRHIFPSTPGRGLSVCGKSCHVGVSIIHTFRSFYEGDKN